jgi:rare lipoprotein A
MRRALIQSLVVLFWITSLGAAPGPKNSESVASSKLESPRSVQKLEVAKSKTQRPYQVGKASWYGDYFQGRPTASGEPYNMYDFTAAHMTLPLGTYVRVTNLSNGRWVIVKVNDRGPVVPGRIIDVSYNTARLLHFKAKGLQRVRLDVVHPETLAMARAAGMP